MSHLIYYFLILSIRFCFHILVSQFQLCSNKMLNFMGESKGWKLLWREKLLSFVIHIKFYLDFFQSQASPIIRFITTKLPSLLFLFLLEQMFRKVYIFCDCVKPQKHKHQSGNKSCTTFFHIKIEKCIDSLPRRRLRNLLRLEKRSRDYFMQWKCLKQLQ